MLKTKKRKYQQFQKISVSLILLVFARYRTSVFREEVGHCRLNVVSRDQLSDVEEKSAVEQLSAVEVLSAQELEQRLDTMYNEVIKSPNLHVKSYENT
jgi:hypothetical protein